MEKDQVKILQVKKFPIYDIFLGQGWKHWSRILVRNKTIKLIGGALLPDAVQLKLLLVLNKPNGPESKT